MIHSVFPILQRIVPVILSIVALMLLDVPSAWAHAQLLSSHPAEDQLLDAAPSRVELVFNEPVTPLVLKLFHPDGRAEELQGAGGTATVVVLLPPLSHGTTALSWRVVSADGHPIGGSLLFSVGARTGLAGVESNDPLVPVALWAGKFLLFCCIFGGGGAAALGLLVTLPRAAGWVAASLTIAGLLIGPATLWLQGLDSMALPLSSLFEATAWETAMATSYAGTVLVAEMAFAAALLSLVYPRTVLTRLAGAAAATLGALSLALSGHASAASPQWITRPAVWIHVAGVLFWAGALLPLLFALRDGSERSSRILATFSKAIPFAVAPLALSGLVLAVVQLGPPSSSWLTAYGYILLCKLGLLAALFALAFWNRVSLTEPVLAGAPRARHLLKLSISLEIVIVVAILGLVAGWRFTPPPRALSEAPQISRAETAHLVAEGTMAMVSVTPKAGTLSFDIDITDLEHAAKSVESVDIILENPTLGIESIRRNAVGEADEWRVEGLALPAGGTWTVTAEIRLSRFEMVSPTGEIDIPG